MTTSSFSEATLLGQNGSYHAEVQRIHNIYHFDFTAVGLAALPGAPLKWLYSAGSTSNRFRRIALAPGHGIGGIVLKAGKPMLFTDIDTEMDPREYSSYPIVFAEDLRSFCALPLTKGGKTVGALLMAFRTAKEANASAFRGCVIELGGRFCDLAVTSHDFMSFETIASQSGEPPAKFELGGLKRSNVSLVIQAQEAERARISREIHDGIAQELAVTSMKVRLAIAQEGKAEQIETLNEVCSELSTALDQLHDLSVQLRPSTLDHFGLLPALRSHARLLEQSFGAQIIFSGKDAIPRFNNVLETQVYRICQEALINASKYAHTDQIHLTVTVAAGWIRIVIEDHGAGFNTEQPEIRGSGCGLHGMRERAALINANLTIESGKDGTRVSLTAPMENGSAPSAEAKEEGE